MKKQYSPEQIVQALKQVDAGMRIKELCRQMGISQPTFYAWKKKYRGMLVEDVKKMKALEIENARLKRLVADLSLDVVMLKDVNSRKW